MNTSAAIPNSQAGHLVSEAATVKAEALRIDTSHAEPVTVGDLEPGDVITSLNGVTFPFPFTLRTVREIPGFGRVLTALHGWFTPRPLSPSTPATRVATPTSTKENV